MSVELKNTILKHFRSLFLLAAFTLFMGMGMASGSPLLEDEWQTHMIDAGSNGSNDVGEYSSIAIGPQGKPFISYYDIGNGDLKFARGDQEKIFPETLWSLETVDAGGDVGKYTSLAIDENGYAHISYYDDSFHDLKYAYQLESGGWLSETVDSTGDVGRYSSLALDEFGYAHISYYDGYPNYNLKYAYYDGSEWVFKKVDESGNVGKYSSLALDSAGSPHISYIEEIQEGDGSLVINLKYTYKDGSDWLSQNPPMGQDILIGDTSLALDRQNKPYIVYVQQTSQITPTYELNYAFWEGEWQYECVDTLGGIDGQISLSLDRNDRPHIAYYDGINGDLKYASLTSSGWEVQIVDEVGDVGLYPSLAMDRYGLPHISYRDNTADNYNLKYATLPFILRQVFIPYSLQDWVRYFKPPYNYEQEDNDAAWQANGALVLGEEYIGYHNDENDFFSIYLRAGNTLNIDLTTEHLEQDENGYYVVQLLLYYGSVSAENRVAWVYEPDYHIEYNGSAGWYYLRVYTAPGYLDGSKQYQFTVSTP